jgi:ATP-binding cassette subfamily B protein
MKRYLIPEAIQTSAMDCGPASLKALLEGFGIHASYGRLREACQTDVDGASIDQVEDAAVRLGLDATQVMTPLDHLLAPEADLLPAMVVVQRPSGATHFVVIWRRHGAWVQIMDPAVGRCWMRAPRIQKDVYAHTQAVAAEAWREWAGSDSFLNPLRGRLRRAGAAPKALVDWALRDPGPSSLARLDAATRMTGALIAAGALARGPEAARLLAKLAAASEEIPDEYWSAGLDREKPENVSLRGAVLIQVRGRSASPAAGPLSPELAAALSEKPARPGMDLLRALRADGFLTPALAAGALAIAAAGLVMEAVLLRGFFDLGRELTTAGQRMAAAAALLVFLGALLALDFTLAGSILRMGRRLEAHLRLAFLAKIPRLTDRYFQSRPVSDMGERCHNVHQLRQAPELAATFLRNLFGMALTVAAIGWLYPESVWAATAVAGVAIGIPLLAQPVLAERDLRVRTHAGALTRYYLDALLGLTAIRAHSAERIVRREQLLLLTEWARAAFGLQRTVVAVEGLQFGLSLAAAAWLVWSRLRRGGDGQTSGMLLLIYWVLNLPVMGEEAAGVLWQYPLHRNTVLRLLEPLNAPEEPMAERAAGRAPEGAASIRMDGVTVRAAGNNILENITLDLPAGTHAAIVGRSGAGKSSLVGLLLGWHRPAAGAVLVDGRPLDAAALEDLRRHTAWIDPQVRLWNRSLFDNLRYGAGDSPAGVEEILDGADLGRVIQNLPDGMQTRLGEGGGLLSAGEGQRVRMGRAMARDKVRLVILDEAALGLDRGCRSAMLERARERWKSATLIAITHDVGDTLEFDRVLIVENGRIAEDDAPHALAAQPESQYRQLLDAEDALRHGLWSSAKWRRWRLEGGKLDEAGRKGSYARSVR